MTTKIVENLIRSYRILEKYDPLLTKRKKFKFVIETRNFKYLLWVLTRKFGIPIVVKKRIFTGQRIGLHINDPEIAHLLLYGVLHPSEKPLTYYILNNLKKTDVFYDVGANYGYYSLVASNFLSQKNIYSIEPNPTLAKQIKKVGLLQRMYINLRYHAEMGL